MLVRIIFRHAKSGDRAIVKFSCKLQFALSFCFCCFHSLPFPFHSGIWFECYFPVHTYLLLACFDVISLWYTIFMSRFVIICLDYHQYFRVCFYLIRSLFSKLLTLLRLGCKRHTFHYHVYSTSIRHIKLIIFQITIWIILYRIQVVNNKIITIKTNLI